MSKRKQATECILKIVRDGEPHEFHEFQEIAMKTGIINDFKDQAVSNALMWLTKNNPDFRKVQKGEYILEINNKEQMNIEEDTNSFDSTVARLMCFIGELDKFDWKRCSEAQFKEARRKMDVLKKLDSSIKKIQ